ncbi:MAG TPA: hypothetical protein VN887_16180 [Candidatus Angelobacter sp.]|nr:hypothetical protein [Candidatus Angelobacter sp.]
MTKAGIPIAKKAIIKALKTGKLYPYRWPPNYGKYTHVEVCRWVGTDSQTLSPPAQDDLAPYPANGLSYRANRCLSRSAILATKREVRYALRTGVLVPGKRPSNYGPQTHAELCRWTGVNPATLAPALPKHTPSGVGNRSAG